VFDTKKAAAQGMRMSQFNCVAGDARDERTYELSLGAARAALHCTDPPYCLLTRRRKGGDLRDKRQGVKIDRDPVVRFEDVRAYRRFTGDWLPKAAARCTGPLVIWTNFLGKEPIRTVAHGLGYTQAGEFVWAKRTSESDGNEVLLRVYETALVFLRSPLPELGPGDPQRVWRGDACGRASESQAFLGHRAPGEAMVEAGRPGARSVCGERLDPRRGAAPWAWRCLQRTGS
jgi:hypothetical protein